MIRLLLVDDDDFVRGALTRALNRTGGFTVIAAEHGKRALELLKEQKVDAVLTDLQMPVMDGLTLLAELFERGVRLPVAVMTGQAIGPSLRERLHSYGIAATFSKPVDVVELADELQRVLDPKGVARIAGVTLFGLLQLLEVERKDGLVMVQASEREGRLYFDQGALIHAHTHTLEGLDAAYEILGWTEPTVEIFYKRRARQRTIHLPLQQVLMEAARLLDERGRDGVSGGAGPAALDQPADAESLIEQALTIEGAVGAVVVGTASGAIPHSASRQRGLDMESTAEITQNLVRATHELDDAVQEIILTGQHHYHLIRFTGSRRDVVIHLVLDRERASLGMARQLLARVAK